MKRSPRPLCPLLPRDGASACARPGGTGLRVPLVASLLCATLAGCMVGPDYRRPEVDAPKAFLYQPKDATAVADVEGWKRSHTT